MDKTILPMSPSSQKNRRLKDLDTGEILICREYYTEPDVILRIDERIEPFSSEKNDTITVNDMIDYVVHESLKRIKNEKK